MEIRKFTEESLPALLAMSNSLAPPRRQLSLPQLQDLLMDSARGQGKNVRLAYEARELAGYMAWVKGDGGEFFGSPFLAHSGAAAGELIRLLMEQSIGQEWVRVSAFPEEREKARALQGAGFLPVFEFVEFETCSASRPAVELPGSVLDEPASEADVSDFIRLHNASFQGVDNSLPLDEEKGREILGSPLLHPVLSRLWRNHSGQAIAFSLVNRDGNLDAIGVHPSEQGRGRGAYLYGWILSHAQAEGCPRIFSTVSSRNEGSLRLHRRLGIAEVERRTVWQKNLDCASAR